jgi:hypothetical protein
MSYSGPESLCTKLLENRLIESRKLITRNLRRLHHAIPMHAFSYRPSEIRFTNSSAALKFSKPESREAEHLDEGWHLHQPATLRQGGFHRTGGMRPFGANVAEWCQPSL